ncbi:hypothetical protein L5515_008473 [Caenorhabditis briggsae]|uniref:Uncharacterized protein n=1 Tax=Caenorhabditis briggsae TaxID=6238 RepID=A0AAE9F6E6_CAEBR|nr:hypothetical protein L5515_008473 [Caenorhabditis briggsae]
MTSYKTLIAVLFVTISAMASAQSTSTPPTAPPATQSPATQPPATQPPATQASNTAAPSFPSSGAPSTGAVQASSTVPNVDPNTSNAPTGNNTVEATTITIGTSTKSAHGISAFLSVVPIAISMLI